MFELVVKLMIITDSCLFCQQCCHSVMQLKLLMRNWWPAVHSVHPPHPRTIIWLMIVVAFRVLWLCSMY